MLLLVFASVCVYLSVCLSVCLSVSVCLFICLPACLPVCVLVVHAFVLVVFVFCEVEGVGEINKYEPKYVGVSSLSDGTIRTVSDMGCCTFFGF